MLKLIFTGNLVHSPEQRQTPNGKTVTTFQVAVNRGQRDPVFFRVAAWDKLGESCAQYLDKGRKVGVVGDISAHPYLSKEGEPRASLEVTASEIEFLSPREQAPAGADTRMRDTMREQRQAAQQYERDIPEITEGDLPF